MAAEKKMTDEEMAASRFTMEMEGVTLGGDWSEAQKALRECLEELRKEGKLKERKGR